MAITGLHLLLTYQCNFECDHCFVYSCSNAKGVMKTSDIHQILNQAKHVESIDWVYFEGGEPFLYYPIMLVGLRAAKDHGLKTGIVTNAYWATSVDDAKEWLIPIAEAGICNLSISDDAYHYDETSENLSKYACEAAKELGLPLSKITIEDPKKYMKNIEWKGRPVSEGRVLFKGRAAEKLVEGLPTKPWKEFSKCSDEDFADQSRVHIDPLGYVHVCQGITIGNMKYNPLKELFDNFDPEGHPICGPILKGGPAELIREYRVEHEEDYVDECHLCYSVRLKLRKRFPNILAPKQMYGIIS
ncbi:MAG: radical SAM protein [Candidatus Bathyarchaeia archaeon]